jgi:hypothetical protein
MARIKGAAFREFFLWTERTQGTAFRDVVAARLPEDLRARVDTKAPALGLLASEWYPSAIVHTTLDVLAEGKTDDEIERIIMDGNRAVVPLLIRGVYKFMFENVASPELYARFIGRLWRQLHDTGDRAMEITSPTTARSTIARWPGHHPILCLITMHTMASVFEAMRCTNVRVERMACVSKGDLRCEALLTFERPR